MDINYYDGMCWDEENYSSCSNWFGESIVENFYEQEFFYDTLLWIASLPEVKPNGNR